MGSRIGTALLGFLAVLSPMTSLAGEPRSHDGGFFLRLAPGGGFTSSKIQEGPDTLELRGTSGSLDVALGVVVKKNLAIHATVGGWSIVDPTAEFNGIEEQTEDVALSMILFGGGFTYYFGSSNVYLTASAGAAQLNLEIDGDDEDSDTGFAFDVGLGKEWWVGDRWGLGVSATFGYHTVPPGDSNSNLKGPSLAIRFSATMN